MSNPTVTRVQTDTGSYIEPPLEPDWPAIDQLRWHAAVLEADTGIRVTIHEQGRDSVFTPRLYGLSARGWGTSGMPFRSAWTYISAMGSGANQARKLDAEEAQ